MAVLIGCRQLVLAADQLTPRREVRPFHELHQLLGCEVLVDERHASLNHLGQIVRWDRGCHPNRNALGAIYQQVRKARREDDRLKQAPVVVRTKGYCLLGKLDQELASAMMSINAVKGVEIGEGMAAAELTGEENADEIRVGADGQPKFLSNHAGGVLGGLSSGQPVVCRFAVKPTSSILTPRRTIDRDGNETEIVTKGRHDPCVGIRAVPVGEAMMALVLADQLLRHRAQCGNVSK